MGCVEDKVIEVGRVVPVEQLWASKSEARVMFGYKNHEAVFNRLWSTFKNHKDYRDGYLSPTYGVPIVQINKFEEFLLWKDKNKFKGEKV